MAGRFEDAYPEPTRWEPKPSLRDDRHDEPWPWDRSSEESATDDSAPAGTDVPAGRVHFHDLCGHECRSWSCDPLDAICAACDYLRDTERDQRELEGRRAAARESPGLRAWRIAHNLPTRT